MINGEIQRAIVLIEQNRMQDAKSYLEAYCGRNADDDFGQYLLAVVLLRTGQKEDSRALCASLLEHHPETSHLISLSANIDIADENYEGAASKVDHLLSMDAQDEEAHHQMARIRMLQRNYDKALYHVGKCLELDAENIDALNLKMTVENIIGKKSVKSTIEEALLLDPENPSSIANHGLQLLREGKTKEALERVQYALSLDPTNDLARYAMSEAMKAGFFPYRLLRKYQEFTARLSGQGMWAVIIGAFMVSRLLRTIMKSNPSLEPIIFPVIIFISTLFLATWVINPLMNCYLLTNKYGRLLLDNDDKKMAKYTGASLILAMVCVGLYFYSAVDDYLLPALFFGLMMIPLGSFLNIRKDKNRKIITYATVAIAVIGCIGVLSGLTGLTGIALVGIFIYQWIYNGMSIKENARVFD